jgi:hypothetical protein
MIGYVGTGASFYECIRYCLEDKKILTEERKLELMQLDHLQHKNRAEVLEYNKCFGNLGEMAGQFIDVAKLSKRVEKSLFHFSLRLAPGDSLTREQLTEMGRECAKEFGVADNQYITILHKDTKEPHIHIVANRVGFDGKVAKDSNSYRRMDALCRRLELKYQLTQVLSARKFLPEELRHLPRHDSRKEKLKTDIQTTLRQVKTYQEFEQKMKALGYQVLKSRGIAFIDDKKVRIKGSEVGFPLAKIERVLDLKQKITQKEDLLKAKEKLWLISGSKVAQKEKGRHHPTLIPAQKVLKQLKEIYKEEDISIVQDEIQTMMKLVDKIIYDLLKPEYVDQSLSPELLKEAKQKKKKFKHKH